jgi:hypothetical protein
MKKSLIIGCAILLGLTACSSDYLNTSPESSVSNSTIVSSTENAKLAINGISRLMSKQYLSSQGFNGEGTIKTWYGNYPGNDFQKCNLTGWSSVINSQYHERSTSIYDYYPWFYYYKLISNANNIIVNLDSTVANASDRNFIVAQALVYRAYSYSMLVQLYCKRWVDSNSGTSRGLPLRLDTSTGDLEASTLIETYNQIYSDLDRAINLFTLSGQDRESDEYWKPNINVAYAVYARTALNREDWSTAAKYAALARDGYPLMSNDEYASGSHTANNEWIWGVYDASDQTLYYYSFFAYQGSNSNASASRNYPCAISRELIDKIPDTDVRKDLYLIPSEAEYAECDAAGRSKKTLYSRAFSEYGDKLYSSSRVFAYMQFKFTVAFLPGGGPFSLFRSAEMYYIQAEADCHLGNDTEAQELLYEANQERDPTLTKSTKTGDELLEEVKLYRRFDLWGEGFDWFDYKRWNEPIERHTKADGGSFHSTFAVTINPEDCNNWVWVIPNRETDYNSLLTQGQE